MASACSRSNLGPESRGTGDETSGSPAAATVRLARALCLLRAAIGWKLFRKMRAQA